MAKRDKRSVMGYDPLAWMGEAGADEPVLEETPPIAVDEQVTRDENHVDNEILAETVTEDVEDLDTAALIAADNDEETTSGDVVMDTEDRVLDEVTDDLTEIAIAETADAEPVIRLAANTSIQHVVQLHDQLKAALTAFDKVEVAAEAVASIDTAALQLLVSLKKAADKQQKQVAITSPTPRFIESARLLGLADVLNVTN